MLCSRLATYLFPSQTIQTKKQVVYYSGDIIDQAKEPPKDERNQKPRKRNIGKNNLHTHNSI
jgi:hypothetical protein